jgi:PAS domain S-box-containing protein
MPDRPTIIVSSEGQYLDANPAALELLGVTLDELRASPPNRFSAEPSDPEAEAAFRAAWEAAGQPDLGGAGMIRRADGSTIWVKFAIREVEGGSFAVLLTPVPDAPPAPSVVYTVGDVLAAWRAAERRLETLTEDAPERHAILADIDEFRERYQLLFRRGLGGSGGATTA